MKDTINTKIKELFDLSKQAAEIDDDLSEIAEKFICFPEKVIGEDLKDQIVSLAETRAAKDDSGNDTLEEKTGTGD